MVIHCILKVFLCKTFGVFNYYSPKTLSSKLILIIDNWSRALKTLLSDMKWKNSSSTSNLSSNSIDTIYY